MINVSKGNLFHSSKKGSVFIQYTHIKYLFYLNIHEINTNLLMPVFREIINRLGYFILFVEISVLSKCNESRYLKKKKSFQ